MCVIDCCRSVLFFFFKQKTAYERRISDWSSDVCSSDLVAALTTKQVRPSQGQPFVLAHWSTSRWPPFAAVAHVYSSHGQLFALAQCRTSRCPPPAEDRKSVV